MPTIPIRDRLGRSLNDRAMFLDECEAIECNRLRELNSGRLAGRVYTIEAAGEDWKNSPEFLELCRRNPVMAKQEPFLERIS